MAVLMAALGWLDNLDFAGGGVVTASAGRSSLVTDDAPRRRPHQYRYGYRYIAPFVGWLLW